MRMSERKEKEHTATAKEIYFKFDWAQEQQIGVVHMLNAKYEQGKPSESKYAEKKILN